MYYDLKFYYCKDYDNYSIGIVKAENDQEVEDNLENILRNEISRNHDSEIVKVDKVHGECTCTLENGKSFMMNYESLTVYESIDALIKDN